MGQRGRHKVEVKPWTQLQKFCYARNCNCCQCPIPKQVPSLRGHCWVKRAIRKHIEQFGMPDNVETKGIISNEKDIETGG